MKLKTLSAAIIATTALASGAYAGDVTVYGKGNLTVNSYDMEDLAGDTNDESTKLESNASRLGVKGSMDINDSLKAIYKLEYEVFFDDDGKGDGGSNFKQRNTYVGLQGGLGTILVGRHDTPVKLMQGKVDRFNDLPLGDIKNIFEGENRESNTALYSSPTAAGFAVSASWVAAEDDAVGQGTGARGGNDGGSVAVTYTTDMFTLALGSDTNIDDRDLIRLIAEFKLGMAKLGLMWQDAELHDDDDKADESGFLLSGEIGVTDNVVLKAQYALNENEDYNAGSMTDTDYDVTQMAIGADYKLNGNSKLFAYYANIETDVDGGETSDDSTIGVGYELKF